MRLLKDAYGEVLSSNRKDPVDDLGEIRGAIMELYDLFSSSALDKVESRNPNWEYGRVVESLIDGNHFTTIECLKKINEISKKYHELNKGASRVPNSF
jgi:hypothetical protein